MKKLSLMVAASLVACAASLGQGKISFVNDSLHLVYFDPNGFFFRGDASLAGTGVTSSNTPSGITLVVDLYAGTTSASLAFAASTTFSSVSPGRFGPATVTFPSLIGATGFFQVQVRDTSFATAQAALAGGSYGAFSQIFTCVGSTSFTANSIVNHGAPAFSTWADGTFNMDQYGAGSRGAICVGDCIPEPSMPALAGLGAATVLVFRRRK